jgi:glycosyltransferase involved in cell wall biosynthesis
VRRVQIRRRTISVSGAAVRASVIICSRNRGASLRRTLASVSAADKPAGDWEVVVVDNGSTDETADVVASFEGTLPLRRVYEPEPGLSRARNRGVLAAKGEYLIWTDDDVVVDAGWLIGHVGAFAAHPDAALFAGQVRPVLEQPVAPWFAAGERHLTDLVALRDFPSVMPLSSERLPFGANYAVRAAEQRRYLYDPGLGVAPGRRRGGEETAVAKAILASGNTGVTVPASIVSHIIPTSRQTLSYVREFYIAQGEDWPLETPELGGRLIGGIPVWVLRRLLASRVAYLAKRLSGGDWLPDFVRYARWVGTCRRWRAFNLGQPTRS